MLVRTGGGPSSSLPQTAAGMFCPAVTALESCCPCWAAAGQGEAQEQVLLGRGRGGQVAAGCTDSSELGGAGESTCSFSGSSVTY